MTNPEGSLDTITDPKLAPIVKRIGTELRLASLKAVAHASDPARYPMPAEPTALERLMLTRVRTRKPDELTAAISRARPYLALDAVGRKRQFGQLAAVDLHAATAIAAQVRALPVPDAMRFARADLDHLAANPARYLGGVTAPVTAPAGPVTAPQALDRLELRVRAVKCVDETNPEWAGNDEILLGGTAIDESGNSKVIAPFLVGANFDDGETKTYAPPRLFTRFNLAGGGNVWPKTYYVTLLVAEEDNGGLPEFLQELIVQIKAKLDEVIGDLVGSTIPVVSSEIAAVLAAVATAIFDAFVAWIIELWGDDLFPAFTGYAKIKGLKHTFASGTHTSSEKTFTTTAHGGTYQVWFDWRVVSSTLIATD